MSEEQSLATRPVFGSPPPPKIKVVKDTTTPKEQDNLDTYGVTSPQPARRYIVDHLKHLDPKVQTAGQPEGHPVYAHTYAWVYVPGAVRSDSPATMKQAIDGKSEGFWLYLTDFPSPEDMKKIGVCVDVEKNGPLFLAHIQGVRYLIRLSIEDKEHPDRTWNYKGTHAPVPVPEPKTRKPRAKKEVIAK